MVHSEPAAALDIVVDVARVVDDEGLADRVEEFLAGEAASGLLVARADGVVDRALVREDAEHGDVDDGVAEPGGPEGEGRRGEDEGLGRLFRLVRRPLQKTSPRIIAPGSTVLSPYLTHG